MLNSQSVRISWGMGVGSLSARRFCVQLAVLPCLVGEVILPGGSVFNSQSLPVSREEHRRCVTLAGGPVVPVSAAVRFRHGAPLGPAAPASV